MVRVPAGEFTMGSDDYEWEKPIHQVSLDECWIYKTPVTVAQYKRFCAETRREMPPAPSWGWKDDHPVVRVTWDDASAYAKWAEVRLPTEAQWEKAARGSDGRTYPWGNEWDASRLQCSKKDNGDAGETAPVGSFPSGVSPCGALDMAGNAWEWVEDWFGEDYYKDSPKRNPEGPSSGTLRVLRGGSWDGYRPDGFRAAYRGGDVPGNTYDCDGFRCAAGPS